MISQVLPKISRLQVQAASSCRFHVFGLPNNQSSINHNSSSNARIMTKLPPLAPAPIMSSKRMSAANSSNTESFRHGKICRTCDFPPSMWSSDQFLTKHDDCIIDPSIQQRHEELKEKVQRMLLMDVASSIQLQDKLRLIDSIQRLGIAYCFESEIQHILHQLNQHLNYNNDGVFTDLYSSAVLFRLMGEYGFNISSDIFKKFQDNGGTFMDSLKFDLQGMLALYEASYMAYHGEDILDQAQRFSITCLQLALTSPTISPLEHQQVTQAIKGPLIRNCARLKAIHYIPLYSRDMSHNETLLEFATLDYNIVQAVHQMDLNEVSMLDAKSINALPEYMKLIIHALLDLYNEIEEKAKERPYVTHYLKQEFKKLARAYLAEAKWFDEGYVPTLEEHLDVFMVTAGSGYWPALTFAGMEDAKQEAFEWAHHVPKIVEASIFISRFLDEISCDEYERLQSTNGVNCYMKNLNITEEEAKAVILNKVENAWKDVNEELLHLAQNSNLPKPVSMGVANTAKSSFIVIYKYGNEFNLPGHIMKGIISSLFIDSMPI